MFKLFTLFCAGWLSISIKTSYAAEPATVFLENNELHYFGNLHADSNKKIYQLYQDSTPKPQWISIKSKGGDVAAGIELGTWIAKHQLNVRVMEYCFSSCANYVFTAANKKKISNFAVIGFHGGANSTSFDTTVTDKVIDKLPKPEQEKIHAKWKFTLLKLANQERDFYHRINVDERIPSLGQNTKFKNKYGKDDAIIGWYYTLPAFEKLGVKNIEVISPPWQPLSSNGSKIVFEIDVDNFD